MSSIQISSKIPWIVGIIFSAVIGGCFYLWTCAIGVNQYPATIGQWGQFAAWAGFFGLMIAFRRWWYKTN